MDVVQKGFLNLCAVVAEAMYLRVDVLKVNRSQVFIHQECHIRTPCKTQKGGIIPYTVVVACYDNDLCGGNGGKQVIDLLQVLH